MLVRLFANGMLAATDVFEIGRAHSELQSLRHLVCRLLLEKKKTAGLPMVIVTRKNFPANNLKEFVDYVKNNQDKQNEAHGGAGGQMHRACTLLQLRMGTKSACVA